MNIESLLALTLIIPLLTAFVVSLLDKYPDVREFATCLGASCLVIINIMIYLSDNHQGQLVFAMPLDDIPIAFNYTSEAMLFCLVASGLWLVTSIYAIGYMRGHHESNQTRFYSLFAVAIGLVMGLAWSSNLLTLFLFYELITLSTYPLVTHSGSEQAKRGGRIYLTLLMGTSIAFFLPAMMITYYFSGSLTFTNGGILAGNIDIQWVLPIMLLFLLGISKAGVMPFHRWLPSAMVAPTPVSALLHAVAVVKAGVFTVLKVSTGIVGSQFLLDSQASNVLLWFPVVTIVLASFIAMTKDNLKERLAFSTVSQLSYIVLGIFLANSLGILGGGLHIVMHAFGKITLFFAAGAILVATHKTNISELNGLGRSMPWTFTFFAIGALSIIGLPIFGGLWSKWFLLQGTIEYAPSLMLKWVMLGVLLLSSLLNILYLLSIPVAAFFKASSDSQKYTEAPLLCLIGMAIPATLCVVLFFAPGIFINLAHAIGQ